MATKAERVAQGVMDVTLSGSVVGEIQFWINLWVVLEMVDGGWNNAFLECLDGGDGFHGACASKKMTSHGLGGIHADLIGMVAEELGDSCHFGEVTLRSGSAMGVDVFDLLFFNASVNDGAFHAETGTGTIRMRRRDMIGVTRHTYSYQLCIDVGSSVKGMFQLFQDDAATTFTHDEAVTIQVERPRSCQRIVVRGQKEKSERISKNL